MATEWSDYGTFTLSAYRAYLLYELISQDLTANRSRVRRTLYAKKMSGSGYRGGDSDYPCRITDSNGGGSTGAQTWGPYNFATSSEVTAYTDVVWIDHNEDGTKSFTATATISGASTLGSASVSLSVTLPTIARASKPTVSGSVTLQASGTGALTISTNRASSTFTHRLYYSFGSLTDRHIASDVGSSYTWAVPASLLAQMPNATSAKGTITCKTYRGTTHIGTNTVSFTVAAHSSVVPTLDGLDVSEAVAEVAAGVGAYVQGKSRLAYAINGAAGVQGSTIKSYKLEAAGQTLSAASGTTGVLTESGAVAVKATVTDSRGRSASQTVSIEVLPWAAPKATSFKVQRCTATGVVDANGTHLKLTLVGSVDALLVGGVPKNTLAIRGQSKLRTASSFTDKGAVVYTPTLVGEKLNVSVSWVIGSDSDPYAVALSYDVQALLTDLFATGNTSVVAVPVAAILMDWGDNTLGVGKYWERGTLDVGGDVYTTGRFRGLANHVGVNAGNGRAYFSADPGGATNGTYVAVSPPEDTSTATALWVHHDGSNVFTVTKSGNINMASQAFAEAAGIATWAADIAPSTVGTVTVTFPSGRFNVAPVVVAAPASTVPHYRPIGVGGISASGCTLYQYNGGGSANRAAAHWHAKQMTSTAAGG